MRPVVLLVLLAGCAAAPERRSTITEQRPGEAHPRSEHGEIFERGLASWYGREQQGGPTASGERFDMHQLTAAHKKLPMQTRVRVTNQLNGRSVVVRINDRGPYAHGRVIDLSRAAAVELDMIDRGVVPVTLERLR